MITITLERHRLIWLLDHLDLEAMKIEQDLMSEDSLKDGVRLVENKDDLEMINSITNTIQSGGMI